MDQNIEPKIEPEKKFKKKNIIILAIVSLLAILILVGIWAWWAQKGIVPQEITRTTAPSQPSAVVQPTPSEDSVSAINQELNNIDIGDLDKEFQVIDVDLNSL